MLWSPKLSHLFHNAVGQRLSAAMLINAASKAGGQVVLLAVSISLVSGCASMTPLNAPIIHPSLTAAMPAIDRQGRIAYVEEQGRGEDKRSSLYLIRPDGSDRQLLTSVNGYIYAPAWSADGQMLAYSVQTPRNYPFIYEYDLRTGKQRQLVTLKGSNLSPSFSPDGSKLLFASTQGGNADIYEIELAQGKLRQLTSLPSTEVQPSYAPDGRSFIYVSDKVRAGRPQLYRYDFATGKSTRLATGAYAASPRLSMDGSKLSYLNGRQAAVMTLATGTVVNLAETGVDEAPSLSPSNQYAVYAMRDSQGNSSMVIRALNGGASYTITSKAGGQVRAPVWGR